MNSSAAPCQSMAKVSTKKNVLSDFNLTLEHQIRTFNNSSKLDDYLFDARLKYDINKKFGKKPLKTFPLIGILKYKVYYQYILGMKIFKPLNLVPFIKKDAEILLKEKFSWESFPHKHHESRFTRFLEDYWLPRKFGFDRRKAHFSSLILTGQMTREEALNRIKKPELSEEFLKQEFKYIADKLDLTVDELQKLFDGKNKTFHDYKTKIKVIKLGAKILTYLGLEKRLFR